MRSTRSFRTCCPFPAPPPECPLSSSGLSVSARTQHLRRLAQQPIAAETPALLSRDLTLSRLVKGTRFLTHHLLRQNFLSALCSTTTLSGRRSRHRKTGGQQRIAAFAHRTAVAAECTPLPSRLMAGSRKGQEVIVVPVRDHIPFIMGRFI